MAIAFAGHVRISHPADEATGEDVKTRRPYDKK
jgi:hypothetical protein